MMVFDQVQDYEGQQEEKAAQVIQERWHFFRKSRGELK